MTRTVAEEGEGARFHTILLKMLSHHKERPVDFKIDLYGYVYGWKSK